MIARQNRRRKIPLLQSYKNDSHWFHISHSVSYGGPCISLMIGKLKIQSDWKQRRQITQSNLESSVDVEENSNPNQSSPDPYSLISGIANLLKLIEDGQRHLLM